MGTWAEEHVHSLCEEEMDQYEDILNQETIDIFNFVTGKEVSKARVSSFVILRVVQCPAFCFSRHINPLHFRVQFA